MAVISCVECGKQISSVAKACPGCGCPQKYQARSYRGRAIVGLILAFVSVADLFGHITSLLAGDSDVVTAGTLVHATGYLVPILLCASALNRMRVSKNDGGKPCAVTGLAIGGLAFLALVVAFGAGSVMRTQSENDRAHDDFEKTTQGFLQSHPREIPDLPNKEVFDSDGYSFHQDDDGRYQLWRNGKPVPARNTSDDR